MAFRTCATVLVLSVAASSHAIASDTPPSLAHLQLSARGFLGNTASRSAESTAPESYDHPSWIQSCQHIFLDVGSNKGVQVRKFFEPQKYPGAPFVEQFNKAFGAPLMREAPAENSGMCVLGVEPNPEHLERLKAIEDAYTRSGWRVHFYPFAAFNAEGHMGFNKTGSRGNEEDGTYAGGHLGFSADERKADGTIDDYRVRTINLADFVETLPQGSVRLMKMDIEGAEYDTLASMLEKGLLCGSRIAESFIEVHAWGSVTQWTGGSFLEALPKGVHPRSFKAIQLRLAALEASGQCGGPVTPILELDDETFVRDVDDKFAGADAGL